ncbi:MAG: hypothetical protein DRR42_08860 [Gammaproteobacteria bacterium]|nr:MAG: hypothetical protein DRR42_08860 [Gammaproteobacteria bacterium]
MGKRNIELKLGMNYRVSLDFVGSGNASKAYGGSLDAWSFMDITPEAWFSSFRRSALDSIGKKYFPVYRMADGEFRFLMGRKYNFHRRPLLRELVAVSAEKLRIRNPDNWATSWGETYTPEEVRGLRASLVSNIRYIANKGYLACYINDNGLYAFTEYNRHIQPYFSAQKVAFNKDNYIPFHFVCALLTNAGWQDFYEDRNILVVSGTDDESEVLITKRLSSMGARDVEFLRISKTSSMKDHINLDGLKNRPDVCLVAAGIGSANILRQLEPLQTLVLDIGGYISCYVNPELRQHGGVFGLPS